MEKLSLHRRHHHIRSEMQMVYKDLLDLKVRKVIKVIQVRKELRVIKETAENKVLQVGTLFEKP